MRNGWQNLVPPKDFGTEPSAAIRPNVFCPVDKLGQLVLRLPASFFSLFFFPSNIPGPSHALQKKMEGNNI